MVKPVGQPNVLYQIMLASMVENKPLMRPELRGKRDGKGRWVESVVEVPVASLAGNVSALNVDLAARRWIK